EDAESGAADQSYSGEIQKVQPDRSAARRAAKGNVGAVQARRCESRGRLLSHAVADAFPACLLLHAGERHRVTPRQLVVDQRPFRSGSLSHSSYSHRHYHVLLAAKHAAGRYGSSAAEDDEHHGTAHDRLHELVLRGRPVCVLGHQQSSGILTTSVYQSLRAWPPGTQEPGTAG